MKTSEYLDLVRSTLGLPSDYALQKPLGLSKQQLSRYRQNLDAFSDEVALRIADMCQIDAARVLVDMHIVRSKSPEAKAVLSALMEKISASFTNLISGRNPRRYKLSA